MSDGAAAALLARGKLIVQRVPVDLIRDDSLNWRFGLSAGPAIPTDGSHKVVCYMEAWAAYRKQGAEFRDEDVDPWACTHLVYAFASIDAHTSQIEPHDDEYDIVKGKKRHGLMSPF